MTKNNYIGGILIGLVLPSISISDILNKKELVFLLGVILILIVIHNFIFHVIKKNINNFKKIRFFSNTKWVGLILFLLLYILFYIIKGDKLISIPIFILIIFSILSFALTTSDE